MSSNYLTKAEFARQCLVTPSAIDHAVKKGKVVLSSNGMINPTRNKNKQYRAAAIARKQKTAKGKSERTPILERNPENRQKLKRIDLTSEDIDMLDTSDDEFSNTRDNPEEDDPTPDPPPRPKGFAGMEPNTPSGPDPIYEKTEIDYAIEKMRSTTALNKARLAAMVSATIRRDFVDEVISLIGTCISDHLITMGDRLSPDIAAIVGSSEPSVIRRVKEEIDADIRTGIEEMKTTIQRKYHDRLEQ